MVLYCTSCRQPDECSQATGHLAQTLSTRNILYANQFCKSCWCQSKPATYNGRYLHSAKKLPVSLVLEARYIIHLVVENVKKHGWLKKQSPLDTKWRLRMYNAKQIPDMTLWLRDEQFLLLFWFAIDMKYQLLIRVYNLYDGTGTLLNWTIPLVGGDTTSMQF